MIQVYIVFSSSLLLLPYPQVKLAKLSAGRSDGDMDGSCVAEGSQGVNGSLGNTSAAVEDGEDSGETCGKENAAEEMRPQDPSGMARKFWAAL